MDSLKKRYAFKLGGNIVGFLLGFLSASVVPRSLGVANYGNYGYLSNFFTQFIAFLDFKTSTCFYVKLSQRQQEQKLVSFYFYFVLVLLSVLLLATTVFTIPFLKEILFKDQFVGWLFLGCLLAFSLWLIDVATFWMDALGETVVLEKARMFTKVVGVLALLLLFQFNRLSIETYYVLQIAISIGMFGCVFYLLREKGRNAFLFEQLSRADFKAYVREFSVYSSPLVAYMALQFVGAFFDRWLLQHYCGSSEQGLYSLSYSLMQVMSIFVAAIFPLLIREISIAAGNNDFDRIAAIFKRYQPMMFAIIAYFCAFVFTEAGSVVQFFGGAVYKESFLSLRILMLYPLISAFSGMSSAIIYATHKTNVFFKTSAVLTPLGILLDILLIHPSFLNMGASGLAIKIVLTEFISITYLLIVNSRQIELPVFKTLAHFLYFGFFLSMAYLASLCTSVFIDNPLFQFGISGFLYTALLAAMVLWKPLLLGLQRHVVQDFKTIVLTKLSSLRHTK